MGFVPVFSSRSTAPFPPHTVQLCASCSVCGSKWEGHLLLTCFLMLFVLSNQCWKINALISKEISQKTNKTLYFSADHVVITGLLKQSSPNPLQFTVLSAYWSYFQSKFIMQMLATETSWHTLLKSNLQERITHLEVSCQYFFSQLLKNSPYPTKNWPHTPAVRQSSPGRQKPELDFLTQLRSLRCGEDKQSKYCRLLVLLFGSLKCSKYQQSCGCLNRTVSSTWFFSLFAAVILAMVTWEDRIWCLIY